MEWILFVLLLVAVGAFYWVKLKRQTGANRAVSGNRPVAQASAVASAPTGSRESMLAQAERPRKLSTLDTPMIQARCDKLGIFDRLDAHDGDNLKRLIFDHCQKKVEGMWWAPLHTLTKSQRYQNEDACFLILSDRAAFGKELRQDLDALFYMVRESELFLETVETAAGETLYSESQVSDGDYKAIFKLKGATAALEVTCKGGKLDVFGVVEQLNKIFVRVLYGYRLLVLHPNNESWCLVLCDPSAAERAARSKWGWLPIAT